MSALKISKRLLTNKINGKELVQEYTKPKYLKQIYAIIAEDPYIASDNLANFFSAELSSNGETVQGIIEMRDVLFDLAIEPAHINSFMLMAPHTHWEDKMPTVYSFLPNDNCYIIGPHQIRPHEIYQPVSFVFTEDGPMAYEWIDSTVNLLPGEWETAMNLVHQMNDKFWSKKYPIGLTMDFRFKDSMYEKGKSTVELSIVDGKFLETYPGFSTITFWDKYLTSIEKRNDRVVQVSWHPRSDKLYNLSGKEENILNTLRTDLNKMSEAERLSYIQELEKSLV